MKIFLFLLLLVSTSLQAQELFIFTEPASTMPAHSLTTRLTSLFIQSGSQKIEQRQTPELMFGLNKNWMLHTSASLSNFYSSGLRFESINSYVQYRFLSKDALYKHFRMAAFAEAAYSVNKPYYDELSLKGDQTGVQAGLIATQLIHKFALSSTVGIVQSLQKERWQKEEKIFPYQAFNYSVSAGYLLLPKEYTNFKQTNLNLYAELLGQQSLDKQKYYVDFAPGAQLIFNSQAKLNIGYRFPLSNNMHRISNSSLQFSFEWLFFNALKKKKINTLIRL